ncbi:Rho GTPase-activating 35 [Gossypium arboreum]|uniref:Rho GTPase-activating 35 n=1 Tax=Gossypium arboreum TaxID=29729 RepID=A0A0B0P523_GOSAR|nr:Rho GTPase-activating 35 [Gossypium arboreum]
MFMRIVITGDKAWTPSSSILPSDFFEDFDNDILGENEEENTINDVHISSQVMSMVDNSSGDRSDD